MDAIVRSYGRAPRDMRPCQFTLGWAPNAAGSALAEFGKTRVLCTASVSTDVPRHALDKQQGWLTAEYGMLPCATATRNSRERTMANGRTKEIQRLIGRSLRACVDLPALSGYCITLDCDVLQADGGTRTASICGAWLALAQALDGLRQSGKLAAWPLKDQVAAISVGCFNDTIITDLDYSEDSRAQVDSNVVMNGDLQLIEIQGTAEGRTFSRPELTTMLDYAQGAIEKILELQRQTLTQNGIISTK